MRIYIIAAFLFLASLACKAQETELFFSVQSGSPVTSSLDIGYWNYGFGLEQYMADKISVALSYRKMFSLFGSLNEETDFTNIPGYQIDYRQDISSFSVDFESK